MVLKDILKRTHKPEGDKKVFHELRRSSKPILIYGGSDYSEIIYSYLKNNDIETEAFIVDRPYWREGSTIKNRPIKCIEECDIEKYNIVIGFGNVEKSRFIMNNKKLLKSSFYFLWDPVMYYEWDVEYVKDNWDLFLDVFRGLADERSRKTLYELIIAKLNQCCSPQLLEVADSEQHYFNSLTFSHNTEKEIFVDCGAYTGDTILQYARFTEENYKKIYAFEPNKECLGDLDKNIKSLHDIEIIKKGTWNQSTVLKFKRDKEISHITDVDDGSSIEVTTIDNELKSEDRVTFIKMDIEGSELESLQGTTKILMRDMPKLAICCYHKKNDIIDLFHFIKNLETFGSKYKIYMRHHSNSSCETILYGIPENCNYGTGE